MGVSLSLIEREHYGFQPVNDEVLLMGYHVVTVGETLWYGENKTYVPNRLCAEIKNWFRLNEVQDVYHECPTGMMEVSRFYFSSKAIAESFSAALPTFARKGLLFKNIANELTQDGETIEVSAVIKYTLSITFHGKAFDEWVWTLDNIKYRFWFIPKSGAAGRFPPAPW